MKTDTVMNMYKEKLMMNKITFTGKRKDNGNIISGYYLCLHQTDDADLHIIVEIGRAHV